MTCFRLLVCILLFTSLPALADDQADDGGKKAYEDASRSLAFRSKPLYELAKDFTSIMKKHPDGPYSGKCLSIVKMLKRTIEQDQERAILPLKGPRQMGKEERIADLIYRLRNMYDLESNFRDLHRWNEEKQKRLLPGSFCGWTFWQNGGPARILAAIGVDAVPQLVDALDDDTITRSHSVFENTCFRVRDAVAIVLNQIAGKALITEPIIDDDQAAEAKKRVKEWWKEFQRKGAKQSFIDGIESGDVDSLLQAEKLVEHYPDAALPFLQGLLKKLTDAEERYQLIQLTEPLRGEKVDRFLRDQLLSQHLESRISAAEILWKLCKAREAIRTVCKDFHDTPDRDDEMTGISIWRRNFRMICFLSDTCDAEALQTLNAVYPKKEFEFRLEIIERIAHSIPKDETLTLKAREEIEKLLLRGFQEISDRNGFDHFKGSFRCVDWAIYGLTRLWKLSPELEWITPFRTRERMRMLVQNEWRKRQKLPPLPAADFPVIKPLPRNIVEPLVKDYLDEKTEDGKKAIGAKIQALGVGVLPALNASIRNLDKKHPALESLQILASQISFFVVDVRILEGSQKLPEELLKELKRRQSKILTEEDAEKLVTYFWNQTPVGIESRMIIDRPEDGSGTVIWVAWYSQSTFKEKPRENKFRSIEIRSSEYRFPMSRPSANSEAEENEISPRYWGRLSDNIRKLHSNAFGQNAEILIVIASLTQKPEDP